MQNPDNNKKIISSTADEKYLKWIEMIKQNDPSLTIANFFFHGYTCIKSFSDVGLHLNLNQHLTLLRFHQIPEDEHLKMSIVQLLEGNNNLLGFSISKSTLNYEILTKFSTIIATHTGLLYLRLSGIGLDNDGAKILATGLKKNTTLCSINFSNNAFGDEGLEHLLGGLGNNSLLELSLESLDNINSEKALAQFISFFKQHTQLLSLNIDYRLCLLSSLSGNTSLVSLNITSIPQYYTALPEGCYDNHPNLLDCTLPFNYLQDIVKSRKNLLQPTIDKMYTGDNAPGFTLFNAQDWDALFQYPPAFREQSLNPNNLKFFVSYYNDLKNAYHQSACMPFLKEPIITEFFCCVIELPTEVAIKILKDIAIAETFAKAL